MLSILETGSLPAARSVENDFVVPTVSVCFMRGEKSDLGRIHKPSCVEAAQISVAHATGRPVHRVRAACV